MEIKNGGIMKILIIGGKGTIGKKVSNHFSKKHEVLIAGRNSGDIVVDIVNSQSIQAMFESIGNIDAVVCIAGDAKWASFDSMTEEDFYIGLKSKLMGQVNLVRIGQNYLNAGGSFTLSTGILADHPVELTSSPAMVNGGIHSFVKAVSMELQNGIRINVVSSGLVEDAVDKYEAYFPGHNPIPMKKVINGYVKSVEGKGTGEIIRMYDNC
ncbi:MAG: short chain dehydrogenase [Desulfobacterales bacterium]|nr:short chain dehydrogenase [Desulfobacterales bacterium]